LGLARFISFLFFEGALHENADLRVKALQKLYALLKDKCTEIIQLIQRQENSDVLSEIVLALMNGSRDSDERAKLLFGCCLGEIGALDPANVIVSNNLSIENPDVKSKANSSTSSASNFSSSPLQNQQQPPTASKELFMNSSLVGDDSDEFSEYFSHSLIMELSKAYLAARNTHEQDSASYAIQECLKVYGCSATDSNSINKMENKKLWNLFPDYIKEILTPLRTSKYEIKSFDNYSGIKTPIILCENECTNYEEWVYKWCAYLISKLNLKESIKTNTDNVDKEIKIFPKLLFIIRFNVNVALFILPYIIIKIIMLNYRDTIDQIYEEIMSVIQLNDNAKTNDSNKRMCAYQHICSQTVFNIYDHLMRQLNFYRTKVTEIQSEIAAKQKLSKQSDRALRNLISANEQTLLKYRDLFGLFDKFIVRIPQQTMSKASLECKTYCRGLMHYEVYMRNLGSFGLEGSTINITRNHLDELQNLYASMDEIDAAIGILVLRKGAEESLAEAAFRHKINGRLNDSIACLEQMLEVIAMHSCVGNLLGLLTIIFVIPVG
jgi:serine/threonine-protein kinase ATR